MKKILTRVLIFLLLTVSLFGMVSCNRPTDDADDIFLSYNNNGRYNFWALGIQVNLYIYGRASQKNDAASMYYEFKNEVNKLDSQCSTTYSIANEKLSDSDIVKFNRAGKGEEVVIGEYTKIMYDMCLELYDESDGLFDVASFNLTDYWGFAPAGAATINLYEAHPQSRGIPAALWGELRDISRFRDEEGNLNVECYEATTGPNSGKWVLKKNTDDVVYGGTTYRLRIDFGAVAKGYAADIGRALAAKYNLTLGYIDVNSSAYLLGGANNGGWRVDVRDPLHTKMFITPDFGIDYEPVGAIAAIDQNKNKGLSTSADSEKNYVYNSAIYCHILNPKTGYPVNVIGEGTDKGKNYSSTVISATILHESGAMTDAYATIAMLMSENGNWQDAVNWLEAHDAYGVLIERVISGSQSAYKIKLAGLNQSDFIISEDPDIGARYSF